MSSSLSMAFFIIALLVELVAFICVWISAPRALTNFFVVLTILFVLAFWFLPIYPEPFDRSYRRIVTSLAPLPLGSWVWAKRWGR